MGLGLLVGAEIAVAKSLDYAGANVLRAPGSPNEPFYAHMARLGLEQGWDDGGKGLPWWYGAMSSGMTGATDFIAGQVLGGLLRGQALGALEEDATLKAVLGRELPKFSDVLAALQGGELQGITPARADALRRLAGRLADAGDGAIVKKLLSQLPDVTLKAPVTRHLTRALTDPGVSEFAGFVERNLLNERALKGGALGGTIVGHGVAGFGTGLLTGHPALGAVVTLLDSLTEGLLAQKALSGKYEALTTLKCSMLLQGIRDAEAPPDWKGKLNRALVGFTSQMGDEVRLFGEDLANLTHAASDGADVIVPAAVDALATEVADKLAGAPLSHGAERPSEAGRNAVAGYAKEVVRRSAQEQAASLTSLVRAQVMAMRAEVEHHSEVPFNVALARDFAEEKAVLDAELHQWREAGQLVAEQFASVHPDAAAWLSALWTRAAGDLSLVLEEARRILARSPSSIASSMRGDGPSPRSSSTRALSLTEEQAKALGRTILAVAEKLHAPIETPLRHTQRAMRDGTFAVMGAASTVAVKGLLAAEREVRAHEAELAATGAAIQRVGAWMMKSTVALLGILKKSTSAGANALGDLVVRASRGFGDTPQNAMHELELRARLEDAARTASR